MELVPFSVRLDKETKARLEDQAKLIDRSASYVAKEAIRLYLSSCEAKQEAINTALQDADQGHFVSSQRTREWLASLGTEKEQDRPKADVHLHNK